jgi:hypothetical protein
MATELLSVRREFLRAPCFEATFLEEASLDKYSFFLTGVSEGGASLKASPVPLHLAETVKIVFALPEVPLIEGIKKSEKNEKEMLHGHTFLLKARIVRSEAQVYGLSWVELPQSERLILSAYVQQAAINLHYAQRTLEITGSKDVRQDIYNGMMTFYRLKKVYENSSDEECIGKAYRGLEDR